MTGSSVESHNNNLLEGSLMLAERPSHIKDNLKPESENSLHPTKIIVPGSTLPVFTSLYSALVNGTLCTGYPTETPTAAIENITSTADRNVIRSHNSRIVLECGLLSRPNSHSFTVGGLGYELSALKFICRSEANCPNYIIRCMVYS